MQTRISILVLAFTLVLTGCKNPFHNPEHSAVAKYLTSNSRAIVQAKNSANECLAWIKTVGKYDGMQKQECKDMEANSDSIIAGFQRALSKSNDEDLAFIKNEYSGAYSNITNLMEYYLKALSYSK